MRMKLFRITNRTLLPFAAVLAIALAGCETDNIFDHDDASGNATASATFSFDLQVEGQNRMELHGVNGNVELIGVPNAQTVQIWGERRVTSRSSADARAYLDNLQARVTDGSTGVLVETVQPDDNHGRQLQIDYHVRVPYTWLTAIQNTNGNIIVDSLGQTVAVSLTNGNVLAQEINGNVSVSLINGNIALNEVNGSAHVALINGNIGATIVMPPRAECNLNTVNGTITLQIPRDTSAEFTASLAHGTISLVDLTLQTPATSPTSTRGRLGEGSGKISLTTVNGDIHVKGF